VNQDENANAAVSETPRRDALHLLSSILELSDQRRVSAPQITIILDALAGAQDPALVARFPAVLAICSRHGIELNSAGLLGRYWESNPKRQNLEKLLFISAELFRRANISAPRHLEQIAASLRARHASLLAAEHVQLAGGPRVALADMLSALKPFRTEERSIHKSPAPEARRWESVQVSAPLSLLFSEKQKELIFKKLKGLHLTKTEREYYSRVVKKKLAAIVMPEVYEVAAALTHAKNRKDL
jgi:hypothetical protein